MEVQASRGPFLFYSLDFYDRDYRDRAPFLNRAWVYNRGMSALTELSEEERLFQSTVRKFARERLAPHVRAMDEAGVFRKDLLHELFDLGLMAIDVPEEYGGQGGEKLFLSILAIEELARVDPSAAVIVDVQNTLCTNLLQRWGTEDQKRRFLPRLARDTVGSYALSEAGSGSDAFALATRAVCSGDASEYRLTGRKLWITNAAEARTSSSSSRRSIPQRDTKASRHFWWSAVFRASRWARRKTSSAFARHPRAS